MEDSVSCQHVLTNQESLVISYNITTSLCHIQTNPFSIIRFTGITRISITMLVLALIYLSHLARIQSKTFSISTQVNLRKRNMIFVVHLSQVSSRTCTVRHLVNLMMRRLNKLKFLKLLVEGVLLSFEVIYTLVRAHYLLRSPF